VRSPASQHRGIDAEDFNPPFRAGSRRAGALPSPSTGRRASPMVGTAYWASEPAPSVHRSGTRCGRQTLLIIEAMKTV